MSRVEHTKLIAGDNFVGKFADGDVDIIDVTLVADTSIYADNDLLSVPAAVSGFFRTATGKAELVSAVLFDGDDQGTEVELFFTTNSGSMGTINGALNPTDDVADDIQGSVLFAAADFSDLINSQVAQKKNIGLILEADGSSTGIYVFTVVRSGTPTYTASGLKLKLGVRRF